MRAFVRFLTPRGPIDLGPGDMIGRLPSAALCIDDPRISEAHALISLRRGSLCLLSLRRMVAVAGTPTAEVTLEHGQVIELADELTLVVDEVHAPTDVLALRGPALGQRMLAQVTSVSAGPPLSVVGRFVPGADAHLWSAGATWRLRTDGGSDRDVHVGDSFLVGDSRLELCSVRLDTASPATTQHGGGVHTPLRVVAHYDTVEVHRAGRPPVTIGGQSARMLSELIACGGPVAWESAAREIWTDNAETHELRHRWDVTLWRLRRRLRDANVRADLLVADRSGQVQLILYPHDVVEDRT